MCFEVPRVHVHVLQLRVPMHVHMHVTANPRIPAHAHARPDKIQQVKDYKALMKDLVSLQKSMGSSSADEMRKMYTKTSASMEVFLAGRSMSGK